MTHNPLVVGSSPPRPTNKINGLREIVARFLLPSANVCVDGGQGFRKQVKQSFRCGSMCNRAGLNSTSKSDRSARQGNRQWISLIHDSDLGFERLSLGPSLLEC